MQTSSLCSLVLIHLVDMFSCRHFVFLARNTSFTINQLRIPMRTMTSNQKTKIAVVQLNSTEDKVANFSIAQRLVKDASKDGAKMAFLPECFDMICPTRQQTMENGEPIDGNTVNMYRELARENKIWLSLGGLHEKDANSKDSRLFNAHIILNEDGDIVSVYRKVHLFNLDIPGTRLVESEFSQPGNFINKPVVSPCGNVGQGICYDLRFAEFAISLAKGGADIISVCHIFATLENYIHNRTNSYTVSLKEMIIFAVAHHLDRARHLLTKANSFCSILPHSRFQLERRTGKFYCEHGQSKRNALWWRQHRLEPTTQSGLPMATR